MPAIPSSGATIQGTVTDGNTGASSRSSLTSGVTVNVVGTNISALVSVSGVFVLQNVPAGSIQLQFTGGSGAIATLGGVDTGDRLDLKIRLSGSVGVVEASIHIKANGTTVVEGEVTSLSGNCPNLNLVVNGWTLKVDSSSEGGCANIKIGVKVKIRGTVTSTKIVIVVRIERSGGSQDDSDSDSDSDGRLLPRLAS